MNRYDFNNWRFCNSCSIILHKSFEIFHLNLFLLLSTILLFLFSLFFFSPYSNMEELKLERVRNRLLYCPVCLDEFEDPRWLPCLHTVCYQCLQQLKSSSSSVFIQCPECRSNISTREKFPVNFLINSLKEEIAATTSPKLCDLCLKGFHFAKYYCEECSLDLCESCAPEHSLFAHMFSKEDFLFPKSDLTKIKIHNGSECPIHLDEAQQMYCMDCEQGLCVQCYYASHKKHKTMPLKRLSETFKEDIKKEFISLCKVSDEINVCLSELDYFQADTVMLYNLTIEQMNREKALLLESIEYKISQQIDCIRARQKQACASIHSYRIRLNNYYSNIIRGKNIFVKIRDDQINLSTIKSFDRYLKLLKSECQQLKKTSYQLKRPIFLKKWRLTIEPFLWMFLGYVSFRSLRLKLFPLCTRPTWTLKPLGFVLYMITLIFALFTIYKLSSYIHINGLGYDTVFALIIQVYLVISLLLCWL